MAKPLVIVESPAKARTIAGFLGQAYVVESSVGHIRDLPQSAAEVPEQYKGEPWARLGVDTDNDFKPLYVVTGRARQQVRHLKALLADADELYLATDEDREGEAIAWHLLEVLGPRVPVKRMVFHEITRRAIEEAIASPRDIDRRLVDAQEARRILDRLYGYEVSPVLWKKVMPRLSAGRVQSVAVRIIVERERERMAFVAADYWDVDGTFATEGDERFSATLVAVDGARLATGRDFGPDGRPDKEGVLVLDEAGATGLAAGLQDQPFVVDSVESKPYRRRPSAPFMTSTLQQEAGRKLGFTSARTMRAAQRLYENGYITYMRTDSTTLSDEALAVARRLIQERFGGDNLHDGPRLYAAKVKNAQEAHEAIRPAGETWRTPDQAAGDLGADERRVYELVWRRTVASQMIDATGETVTVRLSGTATDGRRATFATSGTVITSPGFRLAYVEDSDDPGDDEDERRLPALAEGDRLAATELRPEGHTTSPPARYTEASLVRRLEELGVGRPSTYASIMETVQDRGYVWKKGSALVPAFTAFATVNLLENHFPDLVDYAFTARMEDDLDAIAGGQQEAVPWLSAFYFGNGGADDGIGLKAMVSDRLGDIDAREVNSIPIGVDADGVPVAARVGRYGPYVERGEDRASIPDDLPPDELTIDLAIELLSAPSEERQLGTDPETGLGVVVKAGRFGPYVQLGTPDDTGDRPRTASLFQSMSLDTVGLDDALRLLSLPRVVGTHPDGEEITAQNGRYGPYLRKGGDSRSLEREEQIFTVTVEEAVALYAQPKRRRGAVERPPLRELGDDPSTGRHMTLKDGRFGPYVTDGETNASLRKGDDIETLTVERASELLAERRAAGPSKKRGRRTAKKRTAKKKVTSKKATKTTATRKRPAAE
jgi:DNA topoisomerase-1